MENKKINHFYKYDVIIIGAGHAGCEAAKAAASTGAKTLMITINLDSTGAMPCNSAIGGPGRGQLVRELDALGGEMAKNTDKNYIHSRIMNISKGPALRTIRAIVDKKRYFMNMKYMLENCPNLDIRQGLADSIITDNKEYFINTSDGDRYSCKCAVIATGTFLRSSIFWGKHEIKAGRQGEISSVSFAYSLEKLGYKFARLRTETPPRVDSRTINTKFLKVQQYDEIPEMFSYESEFIKREQLNNYITYIEKDCINYILENISSAPAILKKNESKSPKYCPSIEDKVNNFYNRARHPVFIQPEGIESNEMYLHGLFTTFSEEVQQGIVRRINGLENAVITRPGYGVEYDYLYPFQLNNTLESKKHAGIYFAGQINGSTGYEEAASQGIIAGYNAALKSKGKKPIVVDREDGYIGVLIDDIVLKGTTEPYRMLTSRNEYRLYHRHDNADFRMVKFLKKLRQMKNVRLITDKYTKIENAFKNIKNTKYYKSRDILEDIKQDRADISIIESIKKQFNLNEIEMQSLIINIKYEQYINREKEIIKKMKSLPDINIPAYIDYESVKNLSAEGREVLKMKRPGSLNQAGRLEGVRATDILSLTAFLKNVSRET